MAQEEGQLPMALPEVPMAESLRRTVSEEVRCSSVLEESEVSKAELMSALREAVEEASKRVEARDVSGAILAYRMCASRYAGSDARLPYLFELEESAKLKTADDVQAFLKRAFDDLVLRLVDEARLAGTLDCEPAYYLHYRDADRDASAGWRVSAFSCDSSRALAVGASQAFFPTLVTRWYRDDSDRLSPGSRFGHRRYGSKLEIRLADSKGTVHLASSPPEPFDGVYVSDLDATGPRPRARSIFKRVRPLDPEQRQAVSATSSSSSNTSPTNSARHSFFTNARPLYGFHVPLGTVVASH